MACTIDGCGREVFARGWCQRHYRKWKAYGDPLVERQTQLHGLSLHDRFNAYVNKEGKGCWEWTGFRDPRGYGRIHLNGKPALAHRISWELHNGEIATEQQVLHRCDNPPCVRPEHLFLGDPAMNCADKIAKKRHRYGVSRGSAHGCAKLTEDQVREIRASDGPSRIVAEQYGVSGRQVRDIRKRKTWRHLGD